jgi:hypothetical protein
VLVALANLIVIVDLALWCVGYIRRQSETYEAYEDMMLLLTLSADALLGAYILKKVESRQVVPPNNKLQRKRGAASEKADE